MIGDIGGRQQVRCSHGMQSSHGFRRLQQAGRVRGALVSGQWLVRPRRPFFKHGVQSWRVQKTSIGLSGFFEAEGRLERVLTLGTLVCTGSGDDSWWHWR